MVTRRARKSRSLSTKSMELAIAVPQVVARRVARMAAAGPNPSARDRKEIRMMIGEKQAAFAQAWSDMAIQAFRANQALTASMFRLFFAPFSYKTPSSQSVMAQAQDAVVGVLNKGLAPVHRRAVSNAKRLAKSKRR
ncbi:MAG TPA: polyhydroxyalkanoate granule-associated phasin [Steroidobacteraceae bacterium]|nr:polyhydroxyalkanoate granule-associated phasin [Steroidobacteraceae bacterium]